MSYTEKELNLMSRDRLREIVLDLSVKFDCDPTEICPARAGFDLLVSSILEAQEEASGQ